MYCITYGNNPVVVLCCAVLCCASQEDSEGPVQMAYLENAPDLPPPTREEVVSPSQSAFGLRAYEEEGEDGEGEAPSEVEEEDFEEDDIGEDDWDTVRIPAPTATVF